MKKVEFLAVIAILAGLAITAWIYFGPAVLKLKPKPAQEEAAVAPGPEAVVSPELEEAVAVRVIRVKPLDFEDVLPALGTVKGYSEVPLKFEVNGIIKEIKVKEGDRAQKGAVIAALKDEDAQLKLQYARKKFESAQAQYQSTDKKKEIFEGLYKAGAVIKQKFEEALLEAEAAKSQVAMAEAEIKIAEADLKKTILISPKDGIIGSKDVEAGEFVTPQNKVVSLYDIEKVYIELGIVEKDIEKIKLGQRAEVQFDTYPQKTFLGRVDNLVPVIEGKSRTLTAKVLLDNPEAMLLPGMFSRARVYLIELVNAIIVPKTSLLPIAPGVNIVPLINPAGGNLEEIEKGAAVAQAELRKVTTGYTSADYVEIIEGLKEGDLVITETRGELKEGLKVKIVGIEDSSFAL